MKSELQLSIIPITKLYNSFVFDEIIDHLVSKWSDIVKNVYQNFLEPK